MAHEGSKTRQYRLVRLLTSALLSCLPVAAWSSVANLLPADPSARQLGLTAALVALLVALLFVTLLRRNRELDRVRYALRAALAEPNPIVSALPDLVMLKNTQGAYLSCNDAFCRLFDCDATVVPGKRDVDLVDRETALRWRAADRAAIAAGKAVVAEEWLALPQKQFTSLIEFTRKPVYDNDGQLVGVLSVGRDVTDRYRAERERRRNDSYQRALLDNFPFQIWLKDTEGRYLAANQAFAEAVGCTTASGLVSKTDFDFQAPAVAEAHRADDREVMVNRRKKEVQHIQEGDAGEAWFETYKAPVIDERGSMLGTIGFKRDVTARYRMERAIRDSEQRFRAFFDNHSAILLFVEPGNGQIVDANGAAVEFYGYPRDMLVGMQVDRINTLSPEENARCREKIVDGSQTHFEFRHRLAGGELRDVDVYSAAVMVDGQQLLLSIVHDITERVRVRSALEEEHQLFASGPVVVFTWGIGEGWPVQSVSSNCRPILGYSAEELLRDHRRYKQLIHPDDLPGVEAQVSAHENAGVDRFELSYRLRHKHDDYIWVKEFTHSVNGGDQRFYRGYVFDQTAAKQLELSLADERRRLQHVVEGTAAGTWEWNVQTGETRFNERWAEIIGYRLNELVPVSIDTWLEHAHAKDLELSQAALQRHFDGHSDYYECEARMRHRDGHWVWVHDRGRVFEWTDDGRPLWMYGTHLDITNRKLAEIALRENEDRLRMAGLTHYDLLYEWDVASGRLQWFSDVNGLLGYPAGTIGERLDDWLALIHPQDRAQLEEAVDRHTEATDPYEYRYRVRHQDGDYRHWLDRAVPVLDVAARARKWVGVCTDVTERHEAEERQKLAVTVFQKTHEGILVTDADANIIDVNRAFTAITGYSRDEALGQNPRFLSSGHQDAAFYTALWHQLNETGSWSGEIWNRRKDGKVFAEKISINAICDEEGQVQRYVSLFSDITTLKEQQQQLERIAYYDSLTDLPNRVMFGDRLRHAMRHADRNGSILAVVYLDLDGFKEINDTHGHAVGDQVLVALAMRMQNALRADDTLARLGGDEFVAILGELKGPADCVELLPRVLDAAARPLDIGERRLQVSASVGVALYPQAESLDSDQLLRQADQAMYQAKLAGKNRYHFFDTEQDQSIRGRAEQVEEIRTALNEQAFELHYQPKVNMRSGDVIGVEALLRWPQADGSIRAPGDFLPMIEHNELSSQLDAWVIEQALTQLEHWQASGLDLSVSVNIGAFHLQRTDFVDRLRALLAAHPSVEPGDLIIEVLETTALMDLARMSDVIRTAQAMGVVFALDDFGTGFSSLDYLKNLPARQLKIDRGFVRDMLDDRDDLAILEGIVGLANAFSRDLVAEGVESAEHGEILLRLGCEVGQGYGIGRPMPAAQLPSWIAAWRPHPSWRHQQPISREDLPVIFAMVEHRAWVKALQSQLNGKTRPAPEIDPRACNFGHWLNSEAEARYRQQPELETVRRLHDRIHRLAPEILELGQRGELAAAHARLDEVCELRDALIAAMKAFLQTPAG